MIRRPRLRIAALLLLFAAPVIRVADAGPALLVLDRDRSTLKIVDPEAKKVRAEVAVGAGPHEVAAAADGRLAFVANYGTQQEAGRSLSVVDVAAGKELRRADLGALRRPHGLAVVEGNVYFTAEMNRAVGRYNPADDAVDRIVGLGRDGTHMIVAAPDGRTLYTADILSGSVSSIRRDTGKLGQFAVGMQVEGLDVSPDGREVWAGDRQGGKVAVLDAATGRIKETIDTGASMAARLRFTPDGTSVLVPDPPSGTLIQVDAATRKATRRIEVGPAPMGVVVEPGGRRAFVAVAGAGKVAVVDLARGEVVDSIEVGTLSDGMAWAPAPAEVRVGGKP